MLWYTSLVNYKNRHIRNIVDQARPPEPPAEATEPERDHDRSRPSEYLRQRCPLCFGRTADVDTL